MLLTTEQVILCFTQTDVSTCFNKQEWIYKVYGFQTVVYMCTTCGMPGMAK